VNSVCAYLASAEVTDVGRKRRNNEDAVLRVPEAGVFCVADGMGGVQGGEVASQATVDALRDAFTVSPDAPFAVTAAAAARLASCAVNRASQWIKARSEERGLSGAGSTVVMLLFDRVMPEQARVLHAGDSRAYRFRKGKLQQLSTDHSVAAAAGLADDKNLPAMFRGVITRAVGLEETVLLEETPADVAAGDIFLLCSDGLTKMVPDKTLSKLLRKHAADEPESLARLLVGEALKAGGEDNVSVVLVRVAETLPQGPTQEVPARAREVEQEAVAAAAPAAEGTADDEERETGQTAATGQTVDSAGFAGEGVTPPEWSRKAAQPPVTPATPFSGEGETPAVQEEPEPDHGGFATERITRTGLPPLRPARSRRWVWLLALAAAAAAAGTAAFWVWLKR
jgi:protein phosphatase